MMESDRPLNVSTYLQRRQNQPPPVYGRELCLRCLQPRKTCYCRHIQTVNLQIQFVILIHRLEVRRRIATGRMAHLCLPHSELIMGYDFSEREEVNRWLEPKVGRQAVILYPGAQSINLSQQSKPDLEQRFSSASELVVFVIDGTWSTARKMLRRSRNLHPLPRICFTPPGPSRFRVRQQPSAECYSTIEAIHHTIELLGPARRFDVSQRKHDALLHVFDKMVEQQLAFVQNSKARGHPTRHRRRPPQPSIETTASLA